MKTMKESLLPDSSVFQNLRRRLEQKVAEGELSPKEAADLLRIYESVERQLARIVESSDSYQAEMRDLHDALQQGLENVRSLDGFFPICYGCKSVRTEDGSWKPIEGHGTDHSDASFSHGLCPECYRRFIRQMAAAEKDLETVQSVADSLTGEDLDDQVISKYLPLTNSVEFLKDPLYKDFATLFGRYVLLARRVKRIARISDSYHLEFREMKERLERESKTDHLTGLLNRREMYRRLEVERSRAIRHQRPFALIMFDYDEFKAVNDTYGNEAGDRVLVIGSQILQRCLRTEDSCARWGGEEFLILLPECPLQEAAQVAERLRSAFEQFPFEHHSTSFRVTLSLGVTSFERTEKVDACVRRVDANLYQSKHSGRNRIIVR